MTCKQPVPERHTAQDRSPQAKSASSVKVEIYIADHCRICEYTHEVAEAIRRDFPEVELELIDISAPQRAIPEVVFATPTYLLNGRVWSLGNPSLEEMRDRLSAALARATSPEP